MADFFHAALLVCEATMQDIEFQLAAHREILIAILSALARHEDVWPEINRVLDEVRVVQDHEEDPGIVPSEAFARQNAMTEEITAILRAATMRAALDPDSPRRG